MWKLLACIISEDMYCFMEEQKGCKRKSRGRKNQLLIDKTILKDCRNRRTNLAMAWIDYRKALDFVKDEEVETSFEFKWVRFMPG